MTETPHFTITLPSERVEALRAMAEACNLSVSALISSLVVAILDDDAKAHAAPLPPLERLGSEDPKDVGSSFWWSLAEDRMIRSGRKIGQELSEIARALNRPTRDVRERAKVLGVR